MLLVSNDSGDGWFAANAVQQKAWDKIVPKAWDLSQLGHTMIPEMKYDVDNISFRVDDYYVKVAPGMVNMNDATVIYICSVASVQQNKPIWREMRYIQFTPNMSALGSYIKNLHPRNYNDDLIDK